MRARYGCVDGSRDGRDVAWQANNMDNTRLILNNPIILRCCYVNTDDATYRQQVAIHTAITTRPIDIYSTALTTATVIYTPNLMKQSNQYWYILMLPSNLSVTGNVLKKLQH